MKYRRIYLDSYSYYLTLVTQGRKPLLVENIDVLRTAFKLSKKKYTYQIEAMQSIIELIQVFGKSVFMNIQSEIKKIG